MNDWETRGGRRPADDWQVGAAQPIIHQADGWAGPPHPLREYNGDWPTTRARPDKPPDPGAAGKTPQWLERGRDRVLLALAAVAVIVSVSAAYYKANQPTSHPSSSSTLLRLARTAGPYVQLSTPAARQLIRSISDRLGVATQWAAAPVLGAYGKTPTATPRLVLLGTDAAANPAVIAKLRTSAGQQEIIDRVLAGASLRSYPAGQSGGTLRCGASPVGAPATLCLWFDDSTFAVTVDLDATPEEAVADTLLVRGAVER